MSVGRGSSNTPTTFFQARKFSPQKSHMFNGCCCTFCCTFGQQCRWYWNPDVWIWGKLWPARIWSSSFSHALRGTWQRRLSINHVELSTDEDGCLIYHKQSCVNNHLQKTSFLGPVPWRRRVLAPNHTPHTWCKALCFLPAKTCAYSWKKTENTRTARSVIITVTLWTKANACSWEPRTHVRVQHTHLSIHPWCRGSSRAAISTFFEFNVSCSSWWCESVINSLTSTSVLCTSLVAQQMADSKKLAHDIHLGAPASGGGHVWWDRRGDIERAQGFSAEAAAVHVRKERESLLQKKPPKGKNGDCDGENSWISGVSPGEEEEEENVWGGREEVAERDWMCELSQWWSRCKECTRKSCVLQFELPGSHVAAPRQSCETMAICGNDMPCAAASCEGFFSFSLRIQDYFFVWWEREILIKGIEETPRECVGLSERVTRLLMGLVPCLYLILETCNESWILRNKSNQISRFLLYCICKLKRSNRWLKDNERS